MTDFKLWTDDKVKRLKDLWEQGVSMTQIGNQIGMSKNAVCGKVHRLNLAGRPSPIKTGGMPKPQILGAQRSAATARTLLPVVSDSGVPVLVPVGREKATRPYTVGRVAACRYIHGDVRAVGWKYCDAPTVPGKSYCGFHFSICTVVVRDRREDAA